MATIGIGGTKQQTAVVDSGGGFVVDGMLYHGRGPTRGAHATVPGRAPGRNRAGCRARGGNAHCIAMADGKRTRPGQPAGRSMRA